MRRSIEQFTREDLAHLGGGVVAYVREIGGHEAIKLLGNASSFPSNAKLFCLYNADGTPISVSGSREAAIGDARQQDLIPATVH
jgi:hypothetical protein